MKYGFIIDNRKCIGCHACTVACKSEHDVPIGVNRTWVKQTEKGEYPNTRRVFSVLRCNHCTDAPCVEICPTQALYVREDGIVDFNNDRCIGCKSCMQGCPYDALYIDPETDTAAKCNYCAHRVDIGLEPACVNVCPEHAIISGDMDDPTSEIAQTLSREQVTVRKPEKSTKPNVYYIDGDEASLNPNVTERHDQYIWNSQSTGVGHYAKYAEQKAKKEYDEMAAELAGSKIVSFDPAAERPKTTVEVLMAHAKAKRVYDTPDKGILWGWEVSAYVFTKAIAAGGFIVPALIHLLGLGAVGKDLWLATAGISLVFLAITGILLVKDLDQPKRFLYVLFRPHWKSWLVKGGYAITFYGLTLTIFLAATWMDLETIQTASMIVGLGLAVIVAIYTAFLFAQARARDFWQSPTLAIHMLVHSIMAGTATILLLSATTSISPDLLNWATQLLRIALAINLLVMIVELTITHPTDDARLAVQSIINGRYKMLFWVGILIAGNIVPLLLLSTSIIPLPAALFTIAGIYITEHVWVEAPQRIPLT